MAKKKSPFSSFIHLVQNAWGNPKFWIILNFIGLGVNTIALFILHSLQQDTTLVTFIWIMQAFLIAYYTSRL